MTIFIAGLVGVTNTQIIAPSTKGVPNGGQIAISLVGIGLFLIPGVGVLDRSGMSEVSTIAKAELSTEIRIGENLALKSGSTKVETGLESLKSDLGKGNSIVKRLAPLSL